MKNPFRKFAEKSKELRKRPPSSEMIKKISDLVQKEQSAEEDILKKEKNHRRIADSEKNPTAEI